MDTNPAMQLPQGHVTREEPVLPCTNCPNKSARCSTHCKELHKFLRWTDENRAGLQAHARESHVSPEFLDVVVKHHPDLPSWQDVASAGIDYGAIDLSELPSADSKLFEDRYISGMSIIQLARKHDLKPDGVKSRIKRIRRKIKENYYITLLKKAYPGITLPK